MRFDTSQAVLGNSDDEEDPVRRDGDGAVAEEQESAPPPVKKKIPAAGSAVPDAWAKWAALCDPAPAEFLADEFGAAGGDGPARGIRQLAGNVGPEVRPGGATVVP